MKNSTILLMLLFVSLTIINCSKEDDSSSFDGSVKGQVTDPSGSPLYGDLNSNTLVVKLLGKGDKQAIDIRVNGEGKFQNLKLYPKQYTAWLEGPIAKTDTLKFDLATNNNQTADFKLTPLLSPKIISGKASGTTINIDYSVTLNAGNTAKKMEAYCSTAPYPTAAIGSLANVYSTKTVALTTLSGTVAITGLSAGTKYFIRIGAQASSSSLMNYSNQVEVSIP
jgi:hypothetical protein